MKNSISYSLFWDVMHTFLNKLKESPSTLQ